MPSAVRFEAEGVPFRVTGASARAPGGDALAGCLVEARVRQAGGAAHIRLQIRADRAIQIESVGLQLELPHRPSATIIDGYHSWDWCGPQRSPASGWWSAWLSLGSPISVGCDDFCGTALFLVQRERRLELTFCGHPDQQSDRTGEPTPLNLRLAAGARWDSPEVSLARPLPQSAALPAVPVGWMSWNALGGGLCARDVRAVLPEVVERGVVLLDDGWESRWGDWRPHPDLGEELASLTSAIKRSGHHLGLWIAPFLVHPSVELVAQHPDWILSRDGQPLVDRRPGEPHLVLNARLPAVQDHLRQLGRELSGRGADLVKADFLYAAELPSDAGVGVSALRLGLSALRAGLSDGQASPGWLMACGAPAPLVRGLADSCRSGGDAVISVPGRGADEGGGQFWHSGDVVAAQERNARARRLLWGRSLLVDPDAVTLGALPGAAAPDHLHWLRWLALQELSGGPIFSSDRPGAAAPERLDQLHRRQRAAMASRRNRRPPWDDSAAVRWGAGRLFYAGDDAPELSATPPPGQPLDGRPGRCRQSPD